MPRGGKVFLCSGALALTACAQSGELNIRAIADPLTTAAKGNPMVVEGRNLLALGSVGLALEAFRKAAREKPDSIEPLAGMAECYEQMGRFDVARQKYEQALAIAPKNAVLLSTFAAALDRQGLRGEAAEVRAEAAEADAAAVAELAKGAAPVIVPVSPSVFQPMPPARMTAITAAPKLVAPEPETSISTRAPLERVMVAAPVPSVSTTLAARTPVVELDASLPKVMAEAKPSRPQVMEVPVPTKPVESRANIPSAGVTEWTFELPRAAVVERVASLRDGLPADPEIVATPEAPASVSVTVALPPARPPAPQVIAPAKATVQLANASPVSQPRLERLSMGEVALLTRPGPIWKPQIVAENRQSAAIRYVPLRMASAAMPLNVRVLNAARRQGIAALHRNVLLDRGWRRIAIGDAPQVREQSIVLYPANRQVLGRSLAAQFGFRSAVSSDTTELVVLIGRDAFTARARRSAA